MQLFTKEKEKEEEAMKKTSCRVLKHLATEEKQTAKQYAGKGWKSQAKDERKHSKFFKKLAKKQGC